MSGARRTDEALRRGFAALTGTAGRGEACPTSERVWDSAADRLGPEENREVVLHLAECGACATSWRLAREMELAEAVAPGARTTPSGLRRWLPLAAAAAAVVVLGGLALLRLPERAGPAPAFREQEESWLASELPDEALLPRGAALLRWSAGPEGTRYDLRVTTEDLEPLARAMRIEANEFLVPAGKLEGLAEGASLLWRVTAHLPDGRQVHSRSFVTRLE
jgi:hypothetical protein